MRQRARSSGGNRRMVKMENVEGRTGNGARQAKALRETLHKRRLAHAEIAVKRQGDIGWQGDGKPRRQSARLFRRGGDHTGVKLIENAH